MNWLEHYHQSYYSLILRTDRMTSMLILLMEDAIMML